MHEARWIMARVRHKKLEGKISKQPLLEKGSGVWFSTSINNVCVHKGFQETFQEAVNT